MGRDNLSHLVRECATVRRTFLQDLPTLLQNLGEENTRDNLSHLVRECATVRRTFLQDLPTLLQNLGEENTRDNLSHLARECAVVKVTFSPKSRILSIFSLRETSSDVL